MSTQRIWRWSPARGWPVTQGPQDGPLKFGSQRDGVQGPEQVPAINQSDLLHGPATIRPEPGGLPFELVEFISQIRPFVHRLYLCNVIQELVAVQRQVAGVDLHGLRALRSHSHSGPTRSRRNVTL
jgi:hypothetical protein